MTRLRTDLEGKGSYDELVKYVEEILKENFTAIPEKNNTPFDPYERRATNIVLSILGRLGISSF